jgi:hypothetical protein
VCSSITFSFNGYRYPRAFCSSSNINTVPTSVQAVCKQTVADCSAAGGTWLPATNVAWTFDITGFYGNTAALQYVKNAIPSFGAFLASGSNICWYGGDIFL